MPRYETLMLSVPEITTDEAAALQSGLDSLSSRFQAITISFERWGKYKLAYPVRKNEYGVYFLFRFQVAEDKKGDLLKELTTFLVVKNNELIMRHVITALPETGSIEYQRPLSLEETPAREVEVRDFKDGYRSMARPQRSYQKESAR